MTPAASLRLFAIDPPEDDPYPEDEDESDGDWDEEDDEDEDEGDEPEWLVESGRVFQTEHSAP